MLMDINYLIQVHQFPKHLKRLVHRLNGDRVFFYIHLDKKVDIKPFKSELEGLDNVFFIKERVEVGWGHISQVEASLKTIKQAIKDNRNGYYVLMSGQDYPIKPNKGIREYFKNNYGKNFIEAKPVEDVWETYGERLHEYNFYPNSHEKTRYKINNIFSPGFYTKSNFHLIKKMMKAKKTAYLRYAFLVRKHPKPMRPFGGSSWWALPVETIIQVVDYMEANPSFFDYHRHTHCPDEVIFATIIAHLYEAEDIYDYVMYVNWTRKNAALPVTFESENDLKELSGSDCLFARKFKEGASILDKIDRQLLRIDDS